jgi:outer membrane protein OmpA-like peptidoglycan-associated protein
MGAVVAGVAIALAIFLNRGHEETVVLVPAPDGHIGTVVIERDGKKTTLNTAYASSRAVGGREVENATVPPEDVSREFADTLAAIPANPVKFTLYFITGTDELTDESKAELQSVLDELRRRPAPDILVIGHTDTVGSPVDNDALSLQRAQAMREEMLSLGIPPDRIRASGRGERELLIPTDDGIDEPRNRRVEINVR